MEMKIVKTERSCTETQEKINADIFKPCEAWEYFGRRKGQPEECSKDSTVNTSYEHQPVHYK